jgi:hypothetical protein
MMQKGRTGSARDQRLQLKALYVVRPGRIASTAVSIEEFNGSNSCEEGTKKKSAP